MADTKYRVNDNCHVVFDGKEYKENSTFSADPENDVVQALVQSGMIIDIEREKTDLDESQARADEQAKETEDLLKSLKSNDSE